MMSKPKLTGLGVALGAAVGAAFGAAAGHMAVWLAVGVAIGTALGATLHRKQNGCALCEQVHSTHEALQRKDTK